MHESVLDAYGGRYIDYAERVLSGFSRSSEHGATLRTGLTYESPFSLFFRMFKVMSAK
jgi:hypothetical protein